MHKIILQCLPDEQHGFRKAENVQKALDGEFYFFCKVFGIECADKDIEVNLSDYFPATISGLKV